MPSRGSPPALREALSRLAPEAKGADVVIDVAPVFRDPAILGELTALLAARAGAAPPAGGSTGR